MNQELVYELISVMPAASLTGLLVETCTIQRSTGSYNAAGQPDLTASGFANLPGFVNIPCISAVPSPTKIQATEVKDLEAILAKQFRHVMLNGFYPGIEPGDQALITVTVSGVGTTVRYDILGAEDDSQSQQTRLELELSTI
jgi:hypothetical protein